MHRSRFGTAILLGLACLVLFPLAASAQGSIVGLVRDESGGVLPGVTVEVSSPALIEKLRTAVTDEQGRYRVPDLRPGVYRVAFSLTGFSAFVRDKIELSTDTTVTINGDLKVGSLQETITVSGQTPIVDVQQVSRTQVVTRDLIESLPISRNIISLGALVPGVRQQNPDFGGSRLTEIVTLRAHGQPQNQMAHVIDGMISNTYEQQFAWVDEQIFSEVSIISSAIPADTGPGGMKLVNVLKDGGNLMSGAIFLAGSAGSWQSNNVDDNLRKLNVFSATRIGQIQQFQMNVGGPIVRDRIWYFVAVGHVASDVLLTNQPDVMELPDGTRIRAVGDSYIRRPTIRATWQISQKNKLSAYRDRWMKRMIWGYQGYDPRAFQYRDANKNGRSSGNIKYTNVASSSWMIEAGINLIVQSDTKASMPVTPMPAPFTPAWYAGALKVDTALNKNFYPECGYITGCLGWNARNGNNQILSPSNRHSSLFAVSYVTGTHNIKAGMQWDFGPHGSYYWATADLRQNFVNNVASSVTVYSTPTWYHSYQKWDSGVYVQDSWTIKRLTLNPGIRAQWFNTEMQESFAAKGRFVPFRFFEKIANIPNWGPDWAPRFSAAYDLFGDGKTAIKGSVSKYHQWYATNFATRYSYANTVSENRNWYDTDLIPGTSTRSGVVLPTNGDGVAQDNEIGPGTPNFGMTNERRMDPDIVRPSSWEYTASVQHQFGSAAVSAMWYKRISSDIELMDRTLISFADYTSFQTKMPSFANDPTLEGVLDPNEILTVYNLNPAKRASYGVAQVDKTSDSQKFYTGVEASFRMPLAGGSLSASWAAEHNLSFYCSNDDDPNGPTVSDDFGGMVSQGGRFCDERDFNKPFRHEVKVQGSYPIRNWVDVGVVFQSMAGLERSIVWNVPASLFPGGRTNSETILLSKPGSTYLLRYNQLDINFKKNWRVGRKTFSAQLDYFNVLNTNAIDLRNDTIGASLGDATSTMFARLPRVAFNVKW